MKTTTEQDVLNTCREVEFPLTNIEFIADIFRQLLFAGDVVFYVSVVGGQDDMYLMSSYYSKKLNREIIISSVLPGRIGNMKSLLSIINKTNKEVEEIESSFEIGYE